MKNWALRLLSATTFQTESSTQRSQIQSLIGLPIEPKVFCGLGGIESINPPSTLVRDKKSKWYFREIGLNL